MEYRWKALGVVSIGSLMGAIDATVVIIAFPQIARDLSANLVSMVWVLMVYILMGTALVLSLGRISDLKGRKRMYGAAFGVFLLGSALCGLAQSGTELVVFRGLQGIGGAMLVANSFAILSDAFPPNERGRAFGINSVVWGTGSVFGIVLGGLILSVTNWRWIFWINVPIGVVGLFLARAVLRESASPDPRESFDLLAAILFTAGLGAALLGLTEALLTSWTDLATLAPLLLAVPLFAAFFLWEGRWSRDPILPFALFRQWLFTASLAASVLQGIALFAANFLLMIYFQGIRGVSVVTAAYLLIPLSVALGIVGPIGGRLSDRYGARVLSTVGLVIQGGVFLLFSTIQASTPLATVALYEALLGVGGGLFFPANTSAVMLGVPRRQYGVAAGVMMTVRNAAMTLSYTLGLVALTSQLPAGAGAALFGGAFTSSWAASLGYTPGQLNGLFLTGMHAAFHLAAGFVFAAAVFSALRGSEDRGVQLGTAHHRRYRPARDSAVPGPSLP
ncbi:MAG: MFS transporter [Thermoplasmata archaeon]|nr:MFS transporter [Thermoplasmata archaeon]